MANSQWLQLLYFVSYRKILKMEEDFIEKMCNEVISVKPDLVITEKGVSDLAQHYLIRAGITCIRRVRKSDNNRIGRSELQRIWTKLNICHTNRALKLMWAPLRAHFYLQENCKVWLPDMLINVILVWTKQREKSFLNYFECLSLIVLLFSFSLTSVLNIYIRHDNQCCDCCRACGATVVNRTDEIREDDIGTECGLFEVRKIGDE